MSGPERTMLFVYNAGLTARVVGTGKYKGQEWKLGAGTFSIGREDTCSLPLANEAGVSKVHCKITLENNQYILVDAESRNGTIVNGQLVKRAILNDGDEIRICNAVFKFDQEMAMPAGATADQTPAMPAPRAQPAAESTERMQKPAKAARPAKATPKRRRAWPYFLLGMGLFSGAAGGGLVALGVVQLPGEGPAPREVPPPDAPARKGDPVPSGEKPAADKPAAEKPGDKPAATADKPAEKEPANDGPPGTTSTTAPAATTTTATPPDQAGSDFQGTLVKVPAQAGGTPVELKHPTGARVAAVNVKPGDAVKKGQVLVSYDDIEAQRNLATAREIYNQLKVVVQNQDTPRARQELADAKNNLDRAQAASAGARLLAPQDGTVSEVSAQPGKRGARGSVAVTLGGSSPERWTVKARIEGRPAAQTRVGATWTVTVGKQELKGTVSSSEGSGAGVEVVVDLAGAPTGAGEGDSVVLKPAG